MPHADDRVRPDAPQRPLHAPPDAGYHNRLQVAERLHAEWIAFLREHGASDARIRPFVEGNTDVHTPTGGTLYAFRDDHGQWIAFPTERQAQMYAYQENAPGPKREVREVTFGELLADNPKNLIQLHDQYYWAEDLA